MSDARLPLFPISGQSTPFSTGPSVSDKLSASSCNVSGSGPSLSANQLHARQLILSRGAATHAEVKPKKRAVSAADCL